ncbi:MAG: DUF523 domain-containing protein [Candidatus Omnitrophica bacterium]|nr:DUF523 domain-containing protein [Candidatus Omnitrophota bacterium]
MQLCSACLLGICCRYDGKSKPNKKVLSLLKEDVLIPVCPEQLAGLPIPRGPFERKDEQVFHQDGTDFTAEFKRGAKEVLKIAQLYDIKKAIFKQRSPSCGCGQIYDGRFTGTVIKGDGITTQLLKQHGMEVCMEEDI